MPRYSWREAFATYASPAALALLLLGFASGLPYMLVVPTLALWLREAGASLETISYVSLIGLTYAYKCVWSPLLDQWRIPCLDRLGRRRSWLVLTQFGIIAGLLSMSLIDPDEQLTAMTLIALSIAFFSATQDIAVDAYRLELGTESQQAALAASYIAGYRIAVLIGTSGPLLLAQFFTGHHTGYDAAAWGNAYLAFALLMLVPLLLTYVWMREAPLSPRALYKASTSQILDQFTGLLVLAVLLFCLGGCLAQLILRSLFLDWLVGQVSTQALLQDLAFQRTLLYAALAGICLSPLGRQWLRPVLRPQHPVYQLLSVFVLTVLLVSIPGFLTQLLYSPLWDALQGRVSYTSAFDDSHFRRAMSYAAVSLVALSPLGRYCLGAVMQPVEDFVLRYRWQALSLLALIATYRLSDTVMGVMSPIFFLDLGYSKEQMAAIHSVGLVITLLGAGIGGLLTARFGILPILLVGAISSAASNLLFAFMAHLEKPTLLLLGITVSTDNFSAGIATVAFVAYLSSLTNLRFSASQYAFMSSIMLLLPRLLGGYSGTLVKKMGYEDFFTLTAALGIPAFLLILWQMRRPAQEVPTSTKNAASLDRDTDSTAPQPRPDQHSDKAPE